MSQTFDQWSNAKTRLQAIRQRIEKLRDTLGQTVAQLNNWSQLPPGIFHAVDIPMAGFPTGQELNDAAAELRSALLTEHNAYNSLTPDEKSNVKR